MIAVIGILASMLMPGLGRAKAKARSIECINHLKQLGITTLSYAEDNEGRIPVQFPSEPWKTWGSELSTKPES